MGGSRLVVAVRLKQKLQHAGRRAQITSRGTGAGAGTTVTVGSVKRGAYPVMFDFTYADQGTESNVPASDSTVFQLIHKPKPKPIERTQEPTRKPLKPRSSLQTDQ